MNAKLQLQTVGATLLLLLASTVVSPGQSNPFTGVPVPPAAGTPVIDPTTGAPVEPSAQWIDSKWNDPQLILTNVIYDGVPISEVARDLRERFKSTGYFDILPMPDTYGTDWGSTPVKLELRNVRASEVFSAMNLVFENDHRPVRWELRVNDYNHGLVLLRVLPEAAPEQPAQTRQESHRMVFFVGDLIGDEKSGGMTMDQVIKTITDIWPADLGKPDEVIQFHKDAQLLVVNGTRNQLDFIQQTLKALEKKVELTRPRSDDLKELEDLGRILEKQPYSNILKNIFDDHAK